MEEALQHEKAAQRFGLQTAYPQNHRLNGNKTGHALTFILDHLNRADHWWLDKRAHSLAAAAAEAEQE